MQLVINNKGTRLGVKAGAFEISHADGKQKLAPDKVDSILVNRGILVTTDAILLAVSNEIDILFMDGEGQAQARIWSPRFGSVSTIRKKQLHFAASTEGAVWVIGLLMQRLRATQELVRASHTHQGEMPKEAQYLISRIQSFVEQMENASAAPLNDTLKAQLRGWEGAASRMYFGYLAKLVPSRYHFERRSRRPAKDMFNCALNYLYGILYGRLELAMIKAGLDPYIGVFHRDEYNRPVMVYDMIEAYRAWAEAVLLQLCFREALDMSMFSERKGGLWLDTPGKKIVIASMNDYLQEEVRLNNRRRKRLNHMQESCHRLAQEIKKL